MNIELRFFASVREAVGVSRESLVVTEMVQTVGDVRELLCERGGAWEKALGAERRLRMACNQEMAEAQTRIAEGCEVAFFPPVTGG